MSDLHIVRKEKDKNYEAEVRNHRLRIFGSILFVIVVITAACLYARHYFDTRVYTGYEILNKSLRSDADSAHFLTVNPA